MPLLRNTISSYPIDLLGELALTGENLNEYPKSERLTKIVDQVPVQTNQRTFNLGLVYEENSPGRTSVEKAEDFVNAAAASAMRPGNWDDWVKAELNKLSGIGVGLTEAKDDTKSAATEAWKGLTDGTIENFLSKPHAVNDLVFGTTSGALGGMAKDANATNHALVAVGNAIAQASDSYSQLSDYQKGKVIGREMFAFVNPEGNTDAAEAAMRSTKQIVSRVDPSMIETIENTAISMRKMPRDLAECTKQMLNDYIKSNGTTVADLEESGFFRKGYFENLAGSGGNWNIVEGSERYSKDVTLQRHEKSCVAACGQMLSDGKISQDHLIEELRKYVPKEMQKEIMPADVAWLAKELGPEWKGGYLRIDAENAATKSQKLEWLLSQQKPFCAELVEGGPVGHAVVVDGLDEAGNLRIRDPYHATRYEMTRNELLKFWSQRVAFRY